MSLIEVCELHKRYGEAEVLRNVSIGIERGEILAIIGPTGSGKTTLLRLLNLLDTPTGGKVLFDGLDAIGQSERIKLNTRRRMAMVSQKPVVFNANVYSNVAYGLRVRRKGDIHQKVTSALEVVGLSGYEDRSAPTLSGGEMQRVALARAMVIEPEVLLLDEPTANLDPRSVEIIEGLIMRMGFDRRATIVMATHDMSQGQRLAQRIGVLMNGELMQIGRPGEVFSRPMNMKVAEFVGMENIIKGTVIRSLESRVQSPESPFPPLLILDSRLQTGDSWGVVSVDVNGKVIEGISDCRAGEEVYVCIRPEDITLSLATTSSSARNSFTAEIKAASSSGPLARVELGCGFSLVALLTRISAQEMGLEVGKHVYASFKATAVHIIKRG